MLSVVTYAATLVRDSSGSDSDSRSEIHVGRRVSTVSSEKSVVETSLEREVHMQRMF